MAADADTSERFRDLLLERLLISRGVVGRGWGTTLGVVCGTLGGPGLARAAELAHELGLIDGVPWMLCYLLGGVVGLAISFAAGKAMLAARDRIGRSGAEPWRKRAARLALRRGELTDDAKVNRLAAVQARLHRGEPESRRFILGVQVACACLLAVNVYSLVTAVLDGNVSRMIVYAGLVFTNASLITVLLPTERRVHRRHRRFAALYAA